MNWRLEALRLLVFWKSSTPKTLKPSRPKSPKPPATVAERLAAPWPSVVLPASALMSTPVKSLRVMKLMTPPMASEPYSDEAPSSSTSTRWMAAAGMLFRSTPAASPGEAKLAMRRPLSSTSVEDTPRPRRLAALKPIWSRKPP